LLAFARSFCNVSVTQLEPRTPHQPEKLKKLSKNDLVVLLLILQSMKSAQIYLIYFQRSAACPQAGDRIWCMRENDFTQKGRQDAGFRHSRSAGSNGVVYADAKAGCEYPVKALLDKEFGRNEVRAELRVSGKIGSSCREYQELGGIA